MPSLTQSLKGRDLSHLRIVAEQWGVELDAPDARTALKKLVSALIDRELIDEVTGALSLETRDAIADLLQEEGRLPWSVFSRRYGEIRKMGAARRDRERPDRDPISAAETLWYHALIARAFFETPEGLLEHAYVPDDLLEMFPQAQPEVIAVLGRPASPTEREYTKLASDRILDQATTLLGALRLDEPLELESDSLSEYVLKQLLESAGLLDENQVPRPKEVKTFLEAPRDQALAQLAGAWLHTQTLDELRLLPGLSAEGDWTNHPLRTRQRVLDFLSTIPEDSWWSLNAFVNAVKTRHPDYQRPAGDYDSYHLREEESGEFLRGFENWDQVDGALLHFLIIGPLHALGFLDLASAEEGGEATAFKFSGWSEALLQGTPPKGLGEEKEVIHIRSDGRIGIPRMAPRAARYLVSRFVTWLPPARDEYRYQLTPSALTRAEEKGLRVRQLISLLARYSDGIPPNITAALKGWGKHGSQATIEELTVLRLGSPEILANLRKSRAARFLGDPIGPTTVVVKSGAAEKVLGMLLEMGHLGEIIKQG